MLTVIEVSSPSSLIGRLARAADPLCDQHHLALVRELLEQERELVAPESRDRVHRAQHRLQPVGERRQQPVAGGVPKRVVDVLEVVDVEEQHRDGGAGPARAVERDAETIEEQRAVRQPRERVVQRLMRKLDLRALALDRVRNRSPERQRVELGLTASWSLRTGSQCGESLILVGLGAQHDDRHVGSHGLDLLQPVEARSRWLAEQHAHDAHAVFGELMGRVLEPRRMHEYEAHPATWRGASRPRASRRVRCPRSIGRGPHRPVRLGRPLPTASPTRVDAPYTLQILRVRASVGGSAHPPRTLTPAGVDTPSTVRPIRLKP